MSDFVNPFWSWWVIVLTVGALAFCAWLLVTTGKGIPKPPDGAKADTTGHVWDGDLTEYNNPLPKWWSNLFWITILFAVVYLALYPGLGAVSGILGWTSSGEYAAERGEVEKRVAPLYSRFAARTPAARAASRTCATRTGCTAASPRRSSRRSPAGGSA